jgi:hypothetical protein
MLNRKHFLVVFSLIFDLFADGGKKAVFEPFCGRGCLGGILEDV